jgi:hypothetical protein
MTFQEINTNGGANGVYDCESCKYHNRIVMDAATLEQVIAAQEGNQTRPKSQSLAAQRPKIPPHLPGSAWVSMTTSRAARNYKHENKNFKIVKLILYDIL